MAKGISKTRKIPIKWIHIGNKYGNNEVELYCNKNFNPLYQEFDFLGMIDNNSVLNLYNHTRVDIFINTSISEGIPVSVMEAMSFGIPVIATAVGGTPEIVKDGLNGFLLSENPSPEEIAETITKFYLLPLEKKLVMRQNAYQTWKKDYNAEINYEAFARHILAL